MTLEKISVYIHDGGIVSLCDRDLFGKHFEDEKHILHVTERFYSGEYLTKKDLVKVLACAGSLNLVGTLSVQFVLEEGFISEKDIVYIQGVPHVQIYAL
ncbi:DUF424 family protein [Candidatus Woesearchaeota archaeon]|nr:DUF424 family protein [Candidatus Woesearchaeota archaeon]